MNEILNYLFFVNSWLLGELAETEELLDAMILSNQQLFKQVKELEKESHRCDSL